MASGSSSLRAILSGAFRLAQFQVTQYPSLYRSGAVEQLRVHVRNLSMLGVNGAGDSKGRVELYERGYGKDAAGIAKEAITHGNVMHHPFNR